jgi:hypothetical protein
VIVLMPWQRALGGGFGEGIARFAVVQAGHLRSSTIELRPTLAYPTGVNNAITAGAAAGPPPRLRRRWLRRIARFPL